MPFDSEGVFSRLHNWEDDRLNDIDIVSDRHDEEDDNFADGLSQCLLKNGIVPMNGNLNMSGFQIKNLANGQSNSDAVNKAQMNNAIADNSTVIKDIINKLSPIGDIKASLIEENHDNWLLCNGQAVSRETYPDLFSLIGENFGAGDGVTTFNVPDYRGKFLRGLGGDSALDIYTTQAEGLPNITGAISGGRIAVSISGSGALGGTGGSGNGPDWESGTSNKGFDFDASRSSAIYGASNHVTPINQAVNYFIKAKAEE